MSYSLLELANPLQGYASFKFKTGRRAIFGQMSSEFLFIIP